MTREESWQVEGVTLALLRHITDLGYVVSVHRIPESPLGTVGAFVSMRAIDLRTEPITQQMARIGVAEDGNTTAAARAAVVEGSRTAKAYVAAQALRSARTDGCPDFVTAP